MILQFSKAKWENMMEQGKTLGEILFENDTKKLQALDVQQNKKSRVTAAQFASYEAIANTLHSPQLETKIAQPDAEVKEKFSMREPVEYTKDLVALHNLTEEQLQDIQDSLQSRLYSVMEAIDKENGERGETNSLIRHDSIGEIIMEISEGGKYNVADIQNVFRQYTKEISDDTALEVKQLLYDVSQMPVNIFEAKPERAVRFDEVKAAILPKGTDQRIVDGLTNNGVPVQFYESGNNDERLQIVNSMENLKFSEREDSDTVGIDTDSNLNYDDTAINDNIMTAKSLTITIRCTLMGTLPNKSSIPSTERWCVRSRHAGKRTKSPILRSSAR